MKFTLKEEDLEKLIENQEEFEDLKPATYRATFKLSNILKFISLVKNCPDFQSDDDFTHNISITFVREDLHDKKLGYFEKDDSFKVFSQKKSEKELTQLIPIMVGCVTKLDPDNYFHIVSHEYLKDKEGNIPFVRSGGEGTGLIPPPPRPK